MAKRQQAGLAISMLNDNAKMIIMPVWLSTDTINPACRACCQS
jgi:hypothetical protein